ncbi:hypothetical protein COCNU_scaffold000789G000020 [Cocos nucifera]|nr:hypothetical protein [Cocos nucifera]
MVGAPSSAPTAIIVAIPEVARGVKVFPIIEVDATDRGSMPPTYLSPLVEDRAPQPCTEKGKGGENKGKKKIIVKEKAAEVNHLLKKKAVKVEGFQEVIRNVKLTSIGLFTLALEEERRKRAEAKVAELKDQTSRLILEAKAQAVEEFKVSSKIRDMNVSFSWEAFQKGYELCEDRVAAKFSKLDLDFLYEKEPVEATSPSTIAADPSSIELASSPPNLLSRCLSPCGSLRLPLKHRLNPFLSSQLPLECRAPLLLLLQRVLSVCWMQSPIDVELLPQGILLKLIVKNLKKKVHHLRKKLKKAEDEHQKSRENALEATIEVTYLHKLHMKDSANFTNKKGSFEKELAKLKKSASDKSWVLAAKIDSLEVELHAVKEKIQLLEGSSLLSFDKV